MAQPDPADKAGHPNPDNDDEPTPAAKRRMVRDRHGRHEPTTATKRTGPRTTTGPRKTTGPHWTIGPPKVVPMTADEHQQAVQAWAALIASWWTIHPPQQEDDDST